MSGTEQKNGTKTNKRKKADSLGEKYFFSEKESAFINLERTREGKGEERGI